MVLLVLRNVRAGNNGSVRELRDGLYRLPWVEASSEAVYVVVIVCVFWAVLGVLRVEGSLEGGL